MNNFLNISFNENAGIICNFCNDYVIKRDF